jgi:hypothetical protein
MKLAVFWDVILCGLVESYRRFRRACCIHLQDKRWRQDLTPKCR